MGTKANFGKCYGDAVSVISHKWKQPHCEFGSALRRVWSMTICGSQR